MIRLEVKFRDPPEVQTRGEFTAQIVYGMLQSRHGRSVLALVLGQAHFNRGMAPVRADVDFRYVYTDQSRVGELESDNFRELFPDRFGDALGSMLLHFRSKPFDGSLSQFGAQQGSSFVFYRLEDLFRVTMIARDGHGGDNRALPQVLAVNLSHGDVEFTS